MLRMESQTKRRSGPTILFVFDHRRDAARAKVIVERWRTIGTLEDAGLMSEEEWRKTANKSESSIRKFFDARMKRSLVTVVLIGADTHADQWVRYQIQQTHARGDAIVGIYIHNMPTPESPGTRKDSLYFGPLGTDGKVAKPTSHNLRRSPNLICVLQGCAPAARASILQRWSIKHPIY